MLSEYTIAQSMLTTMTCVTDARLTSLAISVLSKTPVVQKVSRVFGETLQIQSQESFAQPHQDYEKESEFYAKRGFLKIISHFIKSMKIT